jgi:hypothetical protein
MDLLRKAKKAAAAAGMNLGSGGKDLKYFQSTKKGGQCGEKQPGVRRKVALQLVAGKPLFWTLCLDLGAFPPWFSRS